MSYFEAILYKYIIIGEAFFTNNHYIGLTVLTGRVIVKTVRNIKIK